MTNTDLSPAEPPEEQQTFDANPIPEPAPGITLEQWGEELDARRAAAPPPIDFGEMFKTHDVNGNPLPDNATLRSDEDTLRRVAAQRHAKEAFAQLVESGADPAKAKALVEAEAKPEKEPVERIERPKDESEPWSVDDAAAMRAQEAADCDRELAKKWRELTKSDDVAPEAEPARDEDGKFVAATVAEQWHAEQAQAADDDPVKREWIAEREALAQLRQMMPVEVTLNSELEQLRQLGETAIQQLGLKTEHDLARLRVNDPAKFQALLELDQQINAKAATAQELGARRGLLEFYHNSLEQRRQAELRAIFEREQDELAAKVVPELSDPATAPAFQKDAEALLTEAGVSDAELRALYYGERQIDMRDARVARVIADAVRWRRAQAAAKNITAAKLPPAQRPGVAGPGGVQRATGAHADVAKHERAFSSATNTNDRLRALAGARAARRAASR
jgi:hypothetical protein